MNDKVFSREKCEIQFSCTQMFGFFSKLSFMMGQDATSYSGILAYIAYIKRNYIGYRTGILT